jgi:hypothetical protein
MQSNYFKMFHCRRPVARGARSPEKRRKSREPQGHISPPSRFSFHGIAGRSRPEEASHKQAERDLKNLKFLLDRQVRAAKMLLPASPNFDAGRS